MIDGLFRIFRVEVLNNRNFGFGKSQEDELFLNILKEIERNYVIPMIGEEIGSEEIGKYELRTPSLLRTFPNPMNLTRGRGSLIFPIWIPRVVQSRIQRNLSCIARQLQPVIFLRIGPLAHWPGQRLTPLHDEFKQRILYIRYLYHHVVVVGLGYS